MDGWMGLGVQGVGLGLGVAALLWVASRIKGAGSPAREVPHPYFATLWLYPPGSDSRWEAELAPGVEGAEAVITVGSDPSHDGADYEGPTEAEVIFCKAVLGDLGGLFARVRPALEEGDWPERPPVAEWRGALSLWHFTVPRGGDEGNPWCVTLGSHPLDLSLTLRIEEGRVWLESVDG